MWTAPAQAEPDAPDTSVVVVIDAGNTDLLVESLVRTTAEAELGKRGFFIVEKAEVGGDTPHRLLACAGNPECSVATLSGIAARYVIFISLRPDEAGVSNNFKIVARNYEVATGVALARTMRRCTECKQDVDLANFSEGVIADLVKEPDTASVSPAPAPLTVIPTPTQTPLSSQVVSGEIPPNEPAQGDGHPLVGPLKYATLVGGVAGLTSGTILVLIDGPVIRDGVRLREERDTLTGGYVSLGAGAVLLGVSAWLWSIDHDEANTSLASIVPALTPRSSGGSLVWTGIF